MRYLVTAGLLLAGLGRAGAQTAPPPATWHTSLPAALAAAQAAQRPVLVVFSGSDWCKPCMMLKQEVFDQPEFAQFAQDRFVLARFDFPRTRKNRLPAAQTQRNEEAAARLNRDGTFPSVVLLAPTGQVLARTGYRPGGATAYDTYLAQLLTKK